MRIDAADPGCLQFALRITGDLPFAGTYYSNEMECTGTTDANVFRHPRVPVTIESNITRRGDDAFTVTLRVQSEDESALPISLYAPLVCGAIDNTAYIPQIGGKVESVNEANYLAYAPGQLTATFFLLQGADAGVALAQEKPVADEANYRTGVLVNGVGIPRSAGGAGGVAAHEVGSSVATQAGEAVDRDLGGVACFVEDTLLPAGQSMVFGPYLVVGYQGEWTAGAARLRELRRPRPLHPWPGWMHSVLAIGELHGRCSDLPPDVRNFADFPALARVLAKAGAPLFHLWSWWDRSEEELQPNPEQNKFWNYAFGITAADAKLGGDDALREAIAGIRAAGSKILLYVDPWQVANDSTAGRHVLERNWGTHTPEGRSTVEGDYTAQRPCPALPEVRRWIIENVLDIYRQYRPDGFFIDEMCAIGYTACYNADHQHPHPYIWSSGLYELCNELRAALDELNPEVVLLAEGGSELLRESLDGYLAHSHSWTGMRHIEPVTRAVVRGIGIFDSLDG